METEPSTTFIEGPSALRSYVDIKIVRLLATAITGGEPSYTLAKASSKLTVMGIMGWVAVAQGHRRATILAALVTTFAGVGLLLNQPERTSLAWVGIPLVASDARRDRMARQHAAPGSASVACQQSHSTSDPERKTRAPLSDDRSDDPRGRPRIQSETLSLARPPGGRHDCDSRRMRLPGLRISTATFFAGAVRVTEVLPCSKIRPDFRSLSLNRSNLQPIYQ